MALIPYPPFSSRWKGTMNTPLLAALCPLAYLFPMVYGIVHLLVKIKNEKKKQKASLFLLGEGPTRTTYRLSTTLCPVASLTMNGQVCLSNPWAQQWGHDLQMFVSLCSATIIGKRRAILRSLLLIICLNVQ